MREQCIGSACVNCKHKYHFIKIAIELSKRGLLHGCGSGRGRHRFRGDWLFKAGDQLSTVLLLGHGVRPEFVRPLDSATLFGGLLLDGLGGQIAEATAVIAHLGKRPFLDNTLEVGKSLVNDAVLRARMNHEPLEMGRPVGFDGGCGYTCKLTAIPAKTQ